VALYLLDTDTIIDFLNQVPRTQGFLADLVAREENLSSCDVVIAEVYAGLYPNQEEAAADFLPTLQCLTTSQAAAEQAGRWRFEFARRGRTLPVIDALIAATALDRGATIVTANLRDYPMPEVSVLPLPR
jgi:predicted nucleic acid-binding protein